MAKACTHCGSVFPHVQFQSGCEWTTKPDELAWKCQCGCVKFILLKSGAVECYNCTGVAPYKAVPANG